MPEQNEQKKNRSIDDKIWDFLSSITLAIIIFSLITITSIIGTIIPQNQEPERTIEAISQLVGSSFAPAVYRVADMLGFTSMYDSWWFISFLFIFAANLIICSIERLPKVWKLIKEPIKPLPVEAFSGMPIKMEIALKKGSKESEALNTIDTTLKKLGFKKILKSEDGLQFYAEKGKYSRLCYINAGYGFRPCLQKNRC